MSQYDTKCRLNATFKLASFDISNRKGVYTIIIVNVNIAASC